MILSDSFLLWGSLILSLIITIGLFFATKKFFAFESKKNLYISLIGLFFICFPISEFILKFPAKTVIVIEYSEEAESYSHKDNIVYGKNFVKTFEEEKISIKGLGLRSRKIYAINLSPSDMIFYAVPYTAAEGIFLFNKDKQHVVPESILLGKGEYVELEKIPEFWFRQPNKYIQTNNGTLKQLFISMFNIEDIRWGVVPYSAE
jgi:hypothetical protein